MTTTAQRQNIVNLIEESWKNGARRHVACELIGLSLRTLQRWMRPSAIDEQEVLAPALVQQQQEPKATVEAAPTLARRPEAPLSPQPEAQLLPNPETPLPLQPEAPLLLNPEAPLPSQPEAPPAKPTPECATSIAKRVSADHRQTSLRRSVTPHNKLTPEERSAVLAVINSEEFKDLPPSQIVPRLADKGVYLASESTMHRLLRGLHQNTHRRSERPAQKRNKPFALKAALINQVYTWDITYLPTTIKGVYFYLYLFVDIFSRHIVGWQVYSSESADQAAALLTDICLRNSIHQDQITLHSDNGSPMKGETMLATMQRLGVAASRSRPSVSNDNPFSESLFRTLKYRPDRPVKPFESLSEAREWGELLVNWYNCEHRHSAIGFVTPEQRHTGQDIELLKQRTALYEQARQKNPLRWSKQVRNWNRIDVVHLNPDKPNPKEINTTK